MWRTIASGQVWKGEICNRHKNGSLYWVSATIVPFLDESGRPYQYFSIRTDITPLKQAQRSLQQTVVDLGERVKEWTCLNAVTHALQDDTLSDVQALQAVVDLIDGATHEELKAAQQALADKAAATNRALADVEAALATTGASRL